MFGFSIFLLAESLQELLKTHVPEPAPHARPTLGTRCQTGLFLSWADILATPDFRQPDHAKSFAVFVQKKQVLCKS